MIAAGVDIKPIDIVVFRHSVVDACLVYSVNASDDGLGHDNH